MHRRTSPEQVFWAGLTTRAHSTPPPHRHRRAWRLAAVLLPGAGAAYLAVLMHGYLFATGGVRRHHVESAAYIFAVLGCVGALLRHRGERVPSTPGLAWRGVPIGLAFLLGSIVLYGPAVFLGLFSDDFVLAERARAGAWVFQESFVRPVPLVLWRLLLSIGGGAAALHLLNIALHGLNAALVTRLAAAAGLTRGAALGAGALFAAFPASVEAVVWPAAVHDLLVTASALAFLNLTAAAHSWRAAFAAGTIAILGLLTKETAVVIPALAAALWLPRRTDQWRGLAAGLAAVAAYAALRLWLVPLPDAYAQAPTRYLVKELVARTYGTLAVPWSAAAVAAWPAVAYGWGLGTIVCATLYATSGAAVVRPAMLARLLLGALVAVLPVYAMFFVGPHLENARYLYLPTAFWSVALAACLDLRGRGERWLFRLAIASGVAIGALGVHLHLRPWREAAQVRDRVLTAALDVVAGRACPVIALADVPDSVRGAYVFRNGLAEAVAGASRARPAPGPAGCTFVWNGSSFQRTEGEPATVQAILRID